MGKRGLLPPGLSYLADNITKTGNILGAPRGAGAKWAKGLDLPVKGETIFYAGCGYQYLSEFESMLSLVRTIDKSPLSTELTMGVAAFQKKLGIDTAGIFRKVAVKKSESDAQPLRDAVKVLKGMGISFGYLAEEEPCCGIPLHFVGLQSRFAQHARGVYDKLKGLGVREIIGVVPSSTNGLRNIYPRYVTGYELRVRHICEVIAENISRVKLKYPRKVKVTYHDPCQLARHMGLVEEPRRILRAIENIEFVEPEWTKGEWATCCGGGGGFEIVFPELSQILSVNRVKELTATGADVIVTQCPGCIMQLKSGLKVINANNVEVLDLIQVVAAAMEGGR